MMEKKNGIVKAEVPAIVGLNQLEKAADYIVRSKLFGVQTKEQAVALMLLAQAEGIHPMKAIQEYHIINGRPAMKADAMLARFLQAGGKVEWHELSDKRAKATFSHPQGGTVTIEWTLDMAREAGLINKDNWKKFPRAMLRARVISEGVRTVYPAIAVGIYTPEEVMDFEEAAPEPEPVQEEVIDAETVEEKDEKKLKKQIAKEIKTYKELLGLTDKQLMVVCYSIGLDWITSLKDLKGAELADLEKLRNKLFEMVERQEKKEEPDEAFKSSVGND